MIMKYEVKGTFTVYVEAEDKYEAEEKISDVELEYWHIKIDNVKKR